MTADHFHECRRCGASIPCSGSGDCWAGDNDGCDCGTDQDDESEER